MNLLTYEWRKLAGMPALWAFAALCFLFNCVLLYATMWTCRSFNEGSAIASRLGQRVDADFIAGFARLPPAETPEERKEQDKLLDFLRQMDDPLERYDSAAIRQSYAGFLGVSPLPAALMDWKLQHVALRAEHFARTGAAMDFFAGPVTLEANTVIYRYFFKALLSEGVVLGVLSMLFLLDYERNSRTSAAVCACRKGRKLWRTKVLAGVTAALALYLLLAVFSFAAFFALWDWSGVWDASMASQFNTGIFNHSDLSYDGYRPFLPWADFTAGSYLLAAAALGAALTAVFTLLTAISGLLIGNAYASALAMVIFVAGNWAVWYTSYMQGCWAVFAPLSFFPASLWDQTLGWFTDGGIIYFIPWQETFVTALWLVLGGGGTALALRRFDGKDVQI